jgi:ABC-2 type transport system ATP-binding protein
MLRRVDVKAIQIRGLHKSYGAVHAVDGINLDVTAGEVFALLGPNGAGKTTTVEIMEGYRKPDHGDVKILGRNPAAGERAFRERIGIVLQDTGMDPFLTVSETIERYRGYYPRPRPLDEVIELVGLQEKRDERVRRLSGGQQRRLDVAIGLAGDPDLLFLDEPTTGFDPSARRRAWEMIVNLRTLGKTVFLTTHYMEEAQQLADRVAIIVSGKLVAEGPPKTLARRDAAGLRITFRPPSGAPALPSSLGSSSTTDGDVVELRPAEPMRALHELTGWAIANGIELEDLHVARPTLEDVYLELTKEAET